MLCYATYYKQIGQFRISVADSPGAHQSRRHSPADDRTPISAVYICHRYSESGPLRIRSIDPSWAPLKDRT